MDGGGGYGAVLCQGVVMYLDDPRPLGARCALVPPAGIVSIVGGMSVGEFAQRVEITPATLAVLKNGHAKAVGLVTLAALCEVLQFLPGDLLRSEPGDGRGAPGNAVRRAVSGVEA